MGRLIFFAVAKTNLMVKLDSTQDWVLQTQQSFKKIEQLEIMRVESSKFQSFCRGFCENPIDPWQKGSNLSRMSSMQKPSRYLPNSFLVRQFFRMTWHDELFEFRATWTPGAWENFPPQKVR